MNYDRGTHPDADDQRKSDAVAVRNSIRARSDRNRRALADALAVALADRTRRTVAYHRAGVMRELARVAVLRDLGPLVGLNPAAPRSAVHRDSPWPAAARGAARRAAAKAPVML